MTCIIIEDQPPAQRILQKYIQDIGNLTLMDTYQDALSALIHLKTNPVDLIFLDIHLPKISGIDFLNILDAKPKVILTTAFPDYALQSYELDVVDYLLKPFSFERFVKAVTKVNTPISHNTTTPESADNPNEFMFIKTGIDYQKIEIASIQFIKSNGDYTHVLMTDAKYLVSQPLKFWIQKLNPQWFCQIHKSYLVHVKFITKVSGNQVYIGDTTLPIGRTYREIFFKDYLNNLT